LNLLFLGGRKLFNSSDEVELECVARSHSLDAVLAEPEHGVSLLLSLRFFILVTKSLLRLVPAGCAGEAAPQRKLPGGLEAKWLRECMERFYQMLDSTFPPLRSVH
jgi:hypothetical protein